MKTNVYYSNEQSNLTSVRRREGTGNDFDKSSCFENQLLRVIYDK